MVLRSLLPAIVVAAATIAALGAYSLGDQGVERLATATLAATYILAGVAYSLRRSC